MSQINCLMKNLLCMSLLLFTCCFQLGAAEHQPELPSAGAGVVDQISLHEDQINMTGWAASNNSASRIVTLRVQIGGLQIDRIPLESFQRPDVVKSTHRPDWIDSGWKTTVKVPDDLKPGSYQVSIDAQTEGHQSFTLDQGVGGGVIVIPPNSKEQKRETQRIKIVIAATLIFLAVCFIKTAAMAGWLHRHFRLKTSEPWLFSSCVLLVLFLFTGIGLTGSSFSLGKQQAPFLQVDMTSIAADARPIRSDEWSVVTPLAIAQYNHVPRYPIINKNQGEDGQNMLVVGLSGVPVSHLSTLAKPATWGFFILDLKRALSWYWCFPIFACFLALAGTLNKLSAESWRKGFALSAVFVSAPNIVAWSNWPGYTLFFPCLAFICAHQMLLTRSRSTLFLLGGVMGLAIAGFILILFPSLQVSIGYVFIAAAIGLVLRDKLYRNITPRIVASYTFAALVACVILGAWWLDAQAAVHTMGETVYPGRRISTGGGMSMAALLRGFTNIATLDHLDSTLSNQSEIAGFYWLLLPILVLFLIRLIQKTVTALEWSLAAVTLFILFYMFIGLPPALSDALLWGRVPLNRTDLALGLATLMLTHLLLTHKNQPARASTLTEILAVVSSLLWVYVVYRSLKQLDNSLISGMYPNLVLGLLLITAAMSYCFITNKWKPFVALSLGLSVATTATFNPVNIAPQRVYTQLPGITEEETSTLLSNKRVLVLENTRTPMFLLASGIAVANGTLYYPQTTLWTRLDPTGTHKDIYNRYQHLTYTLGDESVADYRLDTPYPDIVRVVINPQRFDFRKTGADVMYAPDSDKQRLMGNQGLSLVISGGGWSLFNVLAP